jgi:hypothetical protein
MSATATVAEIKIKPPNRVNVAVLEQYGAGTVYSVPIDMLDGYETVAQIVKNGAVVCRFTQNYQEPTQ